MRAVVTGGCGFIGSNLVDRLAGDGHEVTVIDDLSTGSMANLEGALATGRVRLARLDVSGPGTEQAILDARPEVVWHLAAQIDVRRSVADPVADARVNVLGSIAVARAAAQAGCRRLVFAGSGGTAYGEPDHARLPVDERAPAGATNPYGVAKRTVEDYLDSFRDLWGLEGVSLRLANVYGPRQSPHGEAGVVAIFCNRLLEGRTVTVYGDGRQTRDYVYVGDVVDAFVAAGGVPSEALGATRINIGTGVETSVLELYEALRPLAAAAPEPAFAPPRAGELQRVALDSALAERAIGWRAEVNLDEGLERTWRWSSAQLGR
ncbi:MAG TPA: NAD-dependent epimerase/dehydratase family protein [Actinomycetes bacterium]|nr:NAD-dependent epimerase/dehydratase family protein [Actinomycetes bacterium]